MSSNQSANQPGSQPEKPDPYVEWLDRQDQELEQLGQFIKDNKLGGYSDQFANVDVTTDDDGEDDNDDDGIDESPTRDDEGGKRKDVPPQR